MFITLYRGGKDGQTWDGAWLSDLSQRYHQRHMSWNVIPEDLVDPQEIDFISAKRDEYRALTTKLISDGWIHLGASLQKIQKGSDINWLVTQDSWCIVEAPFDGHFTLFTKDPIVQIKHKMGWFSSSMNMLELNNAVEENNWTVFEIDSKNISEVSNWCDTYCSDIYMISMIYRAPLAGSRTIIFTDPNDAIRFRMTNTNVCRRLL